MKSSFTSTPARSKTSPKLRKRLFLSVLIGLFVTGTVGIVLTLLEVPITVVLPVVAPILVGSTTLAYTALGDHRASDRSGKSTALEPRK